MGCYSIQAAAHSKYFWNFFHPETNSAALCFETTMFPLPAPNSDFQIQRYKPGYFAGGKKPHKVEEEIIIREFIVLAHLAELALPGPTSASL